MGPIQSSLNQLFLSAFGAAGSLAYGFKGKVKKPEVKESESKKRNTEVESGMGNIVKIGRNYSNQNIRSYEAAARSVDSGNEEINSKAKSHFDPIKTRLEEVNKAIASFVSKEKEDKK